MSSSQFPPIAIIADAHFHDLYGDYDFSGIDVAGRNMSARRLTDTVRSTRVFNESYRALRAALDTVIERGMKHVVLLGDYSDDGQAATIRALREVLDGYTRDHGLNFIATPGNHDIFGPTGRHHAKRLLNPDGTYTIVASDGDFVDDDADGVVTTDKMYCSGYPAGLSALPDLGFFRKASDLHWETPFGTDDRPERRLYAVRSNDGRNEYRLMDASYLVEPEPGVWLLMIDANVFEPRNGEFVEGHAGAFVDSTNAGWNAMLKHKAFILDWAKDVAARARLNGKTLLAFSHYPALDMLDDTMDDELAVIGRTSSIERIPSRAVADALIDAGIHIHFSGHLHVNDTARADRDDTFLINIGVPSLVAFPPVFKIITFGEDSLKVETVALDKVPIDPLLIEQYRVEIGVTGKKVGQILDAPDYGTFIAEHVDQLVVHRYLRREWPKDLARVLAQINLGDLAVLGHHHQAVALADATVLLHAERGRDESMERIRSALRAAGLTLDELDAITCLKLLGDWYKLRLGSELGLDRIPSDRMRMYRYLMELFSDQSSVKSGEAQDTFMRLFRMMGRYLSGHPSRNFTIDLATGKICEIE